MFRISDNGIISVNRGDSFELPLFINQGTSVEPMRYVLKEKDELFVAVMECDQPFETALIRKRYTINDLNTNGDVLVRFDHEDTVSVIPDQYYYQVKVRIYNEGRDTYDVHTVIPKTKFFIEE